MTGIELIAQERKEQIEKHGFDSKHDDMHNKHGELLWAAEAVLINDIDVFPRSWDVEWGERILNKPRKEQLIIVGAFIVAELDRINREEYGK